ncbi:MAG: pyridoxamine 5'-phosphate oxidase family protein, partial [Bacillota bacterium]
MDRQMDPAEARILLETLQVGRLGLVLPSGRPYVVPVNFVFLDGRVYVHSAREGSKVEAIA